MEGTEPLARHHRIPQLASSALGSTLRGGGSITRRRPYDAAVRAAEPSDAFSVPLRRCWQTLAVCISQIRIDSGSLGQSPCSDRETARAIQQQQRGMLVRDQYDSPAAPVASAFASPRCSTRQHTS